MEEEYLEFLEDIRILKENHILMKGHERSQGKHFKKIAEKFRSQLSNSKDVNE